MISLTGMYNSCDIMIDQVDEATISQLYKILNHPAFANSQIRIMADTHAGKGSVIGFTMKLNDFVVPNVVGVDINCGVEAYNMGPDPIDRSALDEFIREFIPYGTGRVRQQPSRRVRDPFYERLRKQIEEICMRMSIKHEYTLCSLGTLGGGNHFIEVDKDPEGNYWLVIHTGSRNFGEKICQWHQKKAKALMKELHGDGDAFRDLEYLPIKEGGEEYLKDMMVAQSYADLNRRIIAEDILDFLVPQSRGILEKFQSIKTKHNYINFGDGILRKGAVSAHKGEKLLIPFNMRDGIAVCTGKGNKDWNSSAPHGAGRIMSRTEAKKNLLIEDYEKSMEGIWTSCISEGTIDESPAAYKDMQDIIDCIGVSVDIDFLMKPVYNFKAEEEEKFWRKKKLNKTKEAI